MPMFVQVADVAVFKVSHEDPDNPQEVMATCPLFQLERAEAFRGQPHMLVWIAEQALDTRWPVDDDGNWEGVIDVQTERTEIKAVRYTPKVKGKLLVPVTISRIL